MITIDNVIKPRVRRLFIAALFLSMGRQSAVERELSVKPGLGR